MPVKQETKNKIKKAEVLRKLSGTVEKHPYIVCLITAIILNSIIEIYSRHSLAAYVESIISSPFVFAYSVLIITMTLLISMLFSKRVFVYILISVIWLILGIANGTVLLFRVTPLTGVDFVLVWSVLDIVDVYLAPWQVILILSGLAAVFCALVFLAVRTPRTKALVKKGALTLLTCGIAVAVATNVGIEAGAISDEFPNLADAYEEYGFAYCFARSVLDTGIKKPDCYDNTIRDIKNSIKNDMANAEEAKNDKNPNVVVVQLESFFDPSYMKEYTLSEDAVPNFRKLKESGASGYLTVPSVGAGTVNTEFEVLTGMNLDYFGTCEYPYQTVLTDTATCSLATDLKANGYTAHAMHNNTGTFYGRDTVYSYLGFDTFTPLEYMLSPTYNEIGWANDSVLTGEILRALGSTEGRDFVFAVSVQAHGKYPKEETEGEINVTGGEDEGLTNAVKYYVNQIHMVDKFIGELITALENYDEPVVLVMYGDHLPSLELEDETLTTGDIFKSEYILWSNCGVKAEKRDMSSWQLAPYIMETLDLEGGPVTALHLTEGDSEDFQQKLEALEYDLLYGDFELFNGENPYEPTNIQMGSSPVQVTKWFEENGKLYIRGCNFTKFSTVYIDGDKADTVFMNKSTLMVENCEINDDTEVEVAQLATNGEVFSWAENMRSTASDVIVQK